jgi:hypothetical protein
MKAFAALALAAAEAVGLLPLAACAAGRISRPAPDAAAEPRDRSNDYIDLMIEKYGPPDRVEGGRFVWDRRGRWTKIELSDADEASVNADADAASDIKETIAYPVSEGSRAALALFSGGLTVSGDGAELSARSSGEARNFLMLNLADEVAKGLLTPESARLSYLRALQLSEAGKSSPAMEGLLFP